MARITGGKMSNWEILQALVFEPRKAFAEIAERPKFWFPLLVLIIATVGTTLWYTSWWISAGSPTATCATTHSRAG